jgi:acetyl esterase/lipase
VQVWSEDTVVVHTIGGRELKVDIFRPATISSPVPGLLFLPGGGWQTANRQGLEFDDAIADAMVLFMTRYVPVRQPVTTA